MDQTDNHQLLTDELDQTLDAFREAPSRDKSDKLSTVLDVTRRLLLTEGGTEILESRAKSLEQAGVFKDSDWASPQTLVPGMTTHALASPNADTLCIEALSELRLLPVSLGERIHPKVSAEQAHHYLTQVLAINLGYLFSTPGEAERELQGDLAQIPRSLLQHLANRIGFEYIIDSLIDEIWRILRQRPIQTEPVKQMITQIAICRHSEEVSLGSGGHGAERLVSSLFGPTQACREDPGLEAYRERLTHFDANALQAEASGFARAMHDTGLVSAYHVVLLRYLSDDNDHLIGDALGLSRTGMECLLCYRDLVMALINKGIQPETMQAVYGLAMILERGVLYHPAVAPSLWRQLALPLSGWARHRLAWICPHTLSPATKLLEGVLCMLGTPLGVGQGNNPTCQSARALSLWAHNDPDYLLQIIASAARDDEILMHFEGQAISSATVPQDPYRAQPVDLDPVSIILVPHLDFIYNEMGRLCQDREGDPHRWINPEFHGWWVGRGFCINVDVETGHLYELDDFLRHFHAYYHPYYNANQPLIHPQPAGIAVTDSAARFIGWHAITIQRVALDPTGQMRVYFFNPNNDSGQDWGEGVKVSTADCGEHYGEASLPFEQFASRLYIFHYDRLERGEPDKVPDDALARIRAMIESSWGRERMPAGSLQAQAHQR